MKSLLILTSSTGSGHDKRAEAIRDWCHELYGDSVAVHIEAIIENSSLLGRFGVWLYNQIQKHAPFLHHIYFHIVEAFTFTHRGRVSYGGRYYRKLIKTVRPTHILSVHDSTNNGYFEDARRILGEENVRCLTYCGEFTGGYGFSRNWVARSVDHFYARTPHTQNHAVDLGIPRNRTSIFHKILPPSAFSDLVSDTDKLRLLNEWGLNRDKFTLFLATGGFGANHHLKFLKAILPLADRLQCIVVCGRNQAIYNQVQSWQKDHPQLQIRLEGFSQQMNRYLQVCDAVVSRGGANTSMEALHFECPLLYDTMGGLMPQEYCTVRYFLKNNATSILKKPSDLTRILETHLLIPESYQALKKRLHLLNPNEHPKAFVSSLLGEPC